MITPLLKINIDDCTTTFTNDELLNNIAAAKDNSYKLKIESYLNECNIIGVNVEIESNMLGNEYIIDNIYVDITNIVLSENLENINKYEVITSEIEKVTEIDKSRIIIYG
jgi:hypothetical protein